MRMLATVGVHPAQVPGPADELAARALVRALVVPAAAALVAVVVAGGPRAARAAHAISPVPAIGWLLSKVLRDGAATRLGDLHRGVDLVLDSVALLLAVLSPLGDASLRPTIQSHATSYILEESRAPSIV
jgi:hypothetical protein